MISKIFHKTSISEGDGIHTNIQTTNSFVFIKVLYKYYHICKIFLKIVWNILATSVRACFCVVPSTRRSKNWGDVFEIDQGHVRNRIYFQIFSNIDHVIITREEVPLTAKKEEAANDVSAVQNWEICSKLCQSLLLTKKDKPKIKKDKTKTKKKHFCCCNWIYSVQLEVGLQTQDF